MASKGEKERAANIARHKEMLMKLGLDKPTFEPKEKRHRPAASSKKRKSTNEDSTEPPRKAARAESSPTENEPESTDTSIRRSSRIRRQKTEMEEKKLLVLNDQNDSEPRQTGKRIHDPKVFGSIPGIDVGAWWETREACSNDAIHAPWVGGISGGKGGAYSVALSGGYEDDVDLGYAFTYTGSGGRDLKGTKNNPKNLRTAPQSSDQTFEDRTNKALQRSSETKKPVRVIRGFKLKSKYAPSEGYRYDGLYTIEKAWMEKGLNPEGYLVCKFAFKRLPNQPPLPVRDTDPTEETD
ncbi:hypothetical protein K435DRAFT_961639 [Dendrothele bispora CBS 962.96]|uniref:YDG domain-containing protein n=1 Tax=Dendrothele bispora (strain CBS 962.96) TaxID=1314807 RepID=A0A4S8MQP0_DENBC|nr:hypothetical protein K435DRAFT_961639 [Dendrothele bispora CBS 962.96]